MKTITNEIKDILNRPLPAEAVTPHPSKKFLSSIKSIYVTERLNDAFGVGAWQISTEFIERHERMVVVKTTLDIPEYGIHYESYGGNDNVDLGDAYKGASTDAITKIGSWLGIGADVFKGKHNETKATQPAPKSTRKTITMNELSNDTTRVSLYGWCYKKFTDLGCPKDYDAVIQLRTAYDIDNETAEIFRNGYATFHLEKMTPRS